ncbi:MAG: hypothetical protein ACTS46_01145 [Candidatus Hodgkinia cicadicola]
MISNETSGRFVLNQKCMHHRASWRLPLHAKTNLPHIVLLTNGTPFAFKRSTNRKSIAEVTPSFEAEGNIKTHSYVPRTFRSCLNLFIQCFQHLDLQLREVLRQLRNI